MHLVAAVAAAAATLLAVGATSVAKRATGHRHAPVGDMAAAVLLADLLAVAAAAVRRATATSAASQGIGRIVALAAE